MLSVLTSTFRAVGVLAGVTALVSSAFAQDRILDASVPLASLQQLLNQRDTDGYWPRSIDAHRVGGETRFTVVWEQDPGTSGWGLLYGRTESQLLADDANWSSQGFRMSCVDSYGTYPNELYVAVWIGDANTYGTPTVLLRQTASDVATQVATLAGAGRRVYWIGASDGGGTQLYSILAGAQTPNNQVVSPTLPASFGSTLDTRYGQGESLVCAAAADNGTAEVISGVFDTSPAIATIQAHGLNAEQLHYRDAYWQAKSYMPRYCMAYETPGGERFVATWESTTATRQWVVTGLDVPDLADFDTAVQGYMQAQNIPHGALAVVKDGRLVLARGYSYTRNGNDFAKPDSLFRIASISKPLTAVGVLRLVEKSSITPGQRLNTILDMTGWTDPRVQNIRIRDLLQHTGGWDRDISGDPMFKDSTISTDLSRSLPISVDDVIDWMKDKTLDHDPGTTYAYSNFGYALLGKVIEAVTGEDYETYMLREVMGPIGATDMRVTDSPLGAQVTGEMPYKRDATTTSVMGDGGIVEWQYGGWNIRNMAAHGGWVASAIDLVRFASAFDDPNNSPLLSSASITSMFAKPGYVDPAQTWWYGMGWLGNTVNNQWHDGSLDGTFTLMVRRFDGINYAVLFDKRYDNSSDIDNILYTAASGITTWPTHDLFDDAPLLTTFGHGCGGVVGVPVLRLSEGTAPRMGETFAIQMINLPTVTPGAVMFSGASKTLASGGLPLPFDLGIIGAAGCDMNVDPVQSAAAAVIGGRAAWSYSVPVLPALLGASLYVQGAVIDGTANLLGLGFSAGADVQIGE